MSMALKIDTLKLADDLEAAKGDPRQTARVIGETIGTIDISDLATKADIAEVKTGIKTEFAALYKHLWIMGLGIVALVTALDRLFQ